MVKKTKSNLAAAKKMYPILEGLEYVIVETPDKERPHGLEHFSPGEKGSAKSPRPEGIPLDSYGLHVFKTTKPKDIAGNIISHRLVNEDPYLSKKYKEFTKATPPEVMERRYDWHKKNIGEKRNYDLWAETTGFPELLRGYAFNQFPKKAKDSLYTDEQKQILEEIKTRVTQPNKFNKGGMPMPMREQMEMFEDGGLADEGGTIDEVSGNDVPTGSLKEEVRDDIPAQLSEGEFVLPADVVRYHGLDKIMNLRDEAKAGMARMEDMGQMGNSEEAVLPDDMPFNMEDLEIEDDSETLEMAVGGSVPQQQPYGVVRPITPRPNNTYTMPSAFNNYTQQPAQVQPPVVTPVAPVAPTPPSFLQPPMAPKTQFSYQDLMPGTVRREELNLAGQTGAPTASPSNFLTRTSTGGGSGTGSTATDLAGAAATAYTAYKIAPKVIAGAKSAYAALTGAKSAIFPKVGEVLAGEGVKQYTTFGGQQVYLTAKEAVAQGLATKGVETAALTGADAASKVAAANAGMSGQAGVGINASGIGYAAPTFVAAIALYSLFKGIFGMSSGKANLERYKRERRDKRIKEVIIPYKQMMSAVAGVPYEQLLASQRPPKTPWQDMQDDIRASGVGDMDYELDNARTMFQSNPAFQKQNEEFLAQGDNAKWFNPDMSRTDYMGELYENNPALKAMAEASKNSFVAGTRLPTGAPNPVLVAQEQYTAHLEAGGEPNTFVPDFEPADAPPIEDDIEEDVPFNKDDLETY